MNISPGEHPGQRDSCHHSAACPLEHRPESSRAARGFTRATLSVWNVDETTVDNALLVVSELVTNAIVHALPPLTLHLSQPAADVVRAEVTDGGPNRTQRSSLSARRSPEECGRGNGIITHLTATHGCRAEDGGFSRWAEIGAS
ncbi:ATP-binding protein [Streptomyces aureus]|uniref:ATP-binding protein n=1 Tax=Streptomyces aureus TaxID=193461 RepID=UPI0033C01018